MIPMKDTKALIQYKRTSSNCIIHITRITANPHTHTCEEEVASPFTHQGGHGQAHKHNTGTKEGSRNNTSEELKLSCVIIIMSIIMINMQYIISVLFPCSVTNL